MGSSDPAIFASIAHPTGLYTVDAILAGSCSVRRHLASGASRCNTRLRRHRHHHAHDALVARRGAQEDYVEAARAKGLPERLVLKRHARRNALIPTVTVIGLTFGFLLQGTVVVEIIFRWPGLGRWMADAVLRGDQATIMAYVMFTSVLFLSSTWWST